MIDLKKTVLGLLFLFFVSMSMAQSSALYEKRSFINGKDTLRYRVMFPENFSEEQEYPLILFLHGAGERGNDNEKQLIHGSSLFASKEIRTNYPAIVVFPQCPKEDYWANVDVDRTVKPLSLKFNYNNEPTKSLKLVMGLLDRFLSEKYIKKSQVYIMGLSMGGMGTFELLSRKPNTFAAAVPVCGGGDPESVQVYATTVPVWVFHGAKDDVVDPNLSVQMVSAVLKYGGYPKFTLFDDANHNSWDPAFTEPGLLPWLFSKTLKTY